MIRTPRLAVFLFFLVALLVPLACAQSPTPTNGVDNDPDPTPTETTKPKPTATADPDASATATTPGPDDAPVPKASSVAPNKGVVGAVGPSIVVTGSDFVERSVIQLDGTPLGTTFVSDTELRATIPTAKLAAVGALSLTVGTSPPGGGASKELTFNVEYPAATLTALSPLSVVAGAGATALHVTGTGFANGAYVTFGTNKLPTTFTSDTALETSIPASLLVTSASVPVKVTNPMPGGGESTTISFTVANPNASITTVSPGSAFVGGAALPITVNGTGFIAASAIAFNGNALTTQFVSASQLKATVPATALMAAGDFPVTVQNPPPGGGSTAPYTFHVTYPSPTLSNVTPNSAVAGAAPTEVTVTGGGYFAVSQITFDNAPAATTYVDATHLKATLTAAQLAQGGNIAVRVTNPTPGGGTSTALSFSVGNPAPVMTGFTPQSVPAGSPQFTLDVNGSGFIASSVVRINGTAVATTFKTATHLTAVVSSTLVVSPGSLSIVVFNPTPGGGTSTTGLLQISCDTSAVDLSLTAVGTTMSFQTNFAAATTGAVFADSGSCDATSLDTATLQPMRYWVVQNASSSSLTLSAWADCTADGKGDAFLTFYKRPTAPTTDQDRLACTGVVSEGTNGQGGYGSPDSGGSLYCPGLTKANGGGLVLAACEKAVVHIQPWDVASTMYTPPAAVKIKAE